MLTLKDSALTFLSYMGAIILVLLTQWAKENLKTVFFKHKFETKIDSCLEVRSLLHSLRDLHSSESAMIFKLDSGNYRNEALQEQTLSLIDIDEKDGTPELEFLSNALQQIPLSFLVKLLQAALTFSEESQRYFKKSNDNVDNFWRTIMEQSQTEWFVVYPLKTVKGKLLGVVTVHWKESYISTVEILSVLNILGRISYLLEKKE